MTKQELKAEMERERVLTTSGSQHQLWKKAFEMFNEGKSQKLKMGCGSCYTEVRQWLNS